MRASGYERAANDWYVEPSWLVEALFEAEQFKGDVWDPACGCGTIPAISKKLGHTTFASDISDRGYGVASLDFLDGDGIKADNVVSNPPYNLLEEFVHRGLQVARRRVCFLARLAFLEGQKRKTLFDTTPLARVWVSRRRMSMPPGGTGIEAKGGSIAFAWFVWEHGHDGSPKLGWL